MLEPFGQRREELSLGIIGSTIANVNRNPKSNPKPFDAFDFTLKTPFEISEAMRKSNQAMKPQEIKKFFIELKNSMEKVDG